MGLDAVPCPQTVRLEALPAQVSVTFTAVDGLQRIYVSAWLLAFSASLAVLAVSPALLTAAAVAVAGWGLVRAAGPPLSLSLTPHLLRVAGVGEVPLASIRQVSADRWGRLCVEAPGARLVLPRALLPEEVRWLRAWLEAAAVGARGRLAPGTDAPPAALLKLREARRG